MVHETLLGEALLNAPLAAAVAMDDGRYIACNAAFCALTGYTRDQVLGLTRGLELSAGAQERKNFRDAVAGKRVFGQGTLRCKDGSLVRTNYWMLRTRAAQAENYLVLLWPAGEHPKRRALAS